MRDDVCCRNVPEWSKDVSAAPFHPDVAFERDPGNLPGPYRIEGRHSEEDIRFRTTPAGCECITGSNTRASALVA